MPLFTFRCPACDAEFEMLVRAGDTPTCPTCGSDKLDRQVGALAPAGKIDGLLAAGRAQAAREGHFSNYSKSELSRLKRK